MSSAELRRRLRCRPAFPDFSIVLLSAERKPTVHARCWSTSFRKPAELSVLVQSIDTLISDRPSRCVTAAATRIRGDRAMDTDKAIADGHNRCEAVGTAR